MQSWPSTKTAYLKNNFSIYHLIWMYIWQYFMCIYAAFFSLRHCPGWSVDLLMPLGPWMKYHNTTYPCDPWISLSRVIKWTPLSRVPFYLWYVWLLFTSAWSELGEGFGIISVNLCPFYFGNNGLPLITADETKTLFLKDFDFHRTFIG